MLLPALLVVLRLGSYRARLRWSIGGIGSEGSEIYRRMRNNALVLMAVDVSFGANDLHPKMFPIQIRLAT